MTAALGSAWRPAASRACPAPQPAVEPCGVREGTGGLKAQRQLPFHPHHGNAAVLRDHWRAHHQSPDPPGDDAREEQWRRAVARPGDRHAIHWGIKPYTAFLGALWLADEIMVEFEVARLEPVGGAG